MKMRRVMHVIKNSPIHKALINARECKGVFNLDETSYLVQGEKKLDSGMIRVELEASQ